MCCQSSIYIYRQRYVADTPVMCSAPGENPCENRACRRWSKAALARLPRPDGVLADVYYSLIRQN